MTRTILSLGLAAAALVASTADARTTVAVLEVGKGGVVRRTSTTDASTSVNGVASFWNAVHDGGRRTKAMQYPGMSVVPDLFKRADGGVALGVFGSGVDLASMPTLSNLLQRDAVGRFELSGSQGLSLMKKASKKADKTEASGLASTLQEKVKETLADSTNKLHAVTVNVDDDKAAAAVDSNVASIVKSLQKHAADTGATVVLHLVVEEEEGASRRRRRLEDQQQEEEENEEEEQEAEEEEGDEENDGENNNNNNNNGNYYNNKDSSSSNEKTMFQIQYFNVVLWTALGLTLLLYVTIYMMINMPLMPDTLLFGESSKMVGE